MRRPLIVTACLLLLGALLVVAAPAASAATVCAIPFATAGYPAGMTPVSSTSDDWAQTDGVVIAGDFLYTPGGPYLVVGGNFTKVIEPNGVAVPARSLAVIRLADGHVMWGASSMVGYVKAIQARNGVTYVGGTFTSINGVARKTIAAFSAYDYNLLPWAPVVVSSASTRSLVVSDAGVVYVGGDSSVMAFSAASAARLWSLHADQGPVLSLLLTPDQTSLYVGGFFTGLAGSHIDELNQVNIATHAVNTTFNAHLRPNTPGNDDGELPISLAWDTTNGNLRLVTGTGGGITNTVQSLDPYFGGRYWGYQTEGDSQAVAMVGNTILSGYHRSHDNLLGCPMPYYGTQWASGPGWVLPWDPKLSGPPTLSTGQAKQNGGIQDFAVDYRTRKVYVLGDFSAYGQSCNFATLTCTGGIHKQGIARFSF